MNMDKRIVIAIYLLRWMFFIAWFLVLPGSTYEPLNP